MKDFFECRNFTLQIVKLLLIGGHQATYKFQLTKSYTFTQITRDYIYLKYNVTVAEKLRSSKPRKIIQ